MSLMNVNDLGGGDMVGLSLLLTEVKAFAPVSTESFNFNVESFKELYWPGNPNYLMNALDKMYRVSNIYQIADDI